MAIIQKLTVFKEEKMILYFDGFSNLSSHFFLKRFQFSCFEKKKKISEKVPKEAEISESMLLPH